jgi:hypothetical protein
LVGLDYTAVKLAADCLQIEMTARVFAKIRALEKATIKAANKAPE